MTRLVLFAAVAMGCTFARTTRCVIRSVPDGARVSEWRPEGRSDDRDLLGTFRGIAPLEWTIRQANPFVPDGVFVELEGYEIARIAVGGERFEKTVRLRPDLLPLAEQEIRAGGLAAAFVAATHDLVAARAWREPDRFDAYLRSFAAEYRGSRLFQSVVRLREFHATRNESLISLVFWEKDESRLAHGILELTASAARG